MKKIVVVLMSFIVVGCGNIPTKSAIQEGSILGTVPEGSIVRVIASTPQAGMSPEEIVTGFLNASASSDNDFRIAREYLVPEIRNTWQPTEQIQVYEGQGRINTIENNKVLFTAPLSSIVDENSRITLSEPDAQLVQEFSLKQVENEWRINLAGKGLLISRADLNRSFTTFPIWFPDSSFKTLTPDIVVLPRSTTGVATRLMQLLLAGPAENLTGAVKSAFPVGTSLAINSVPVSNGLATVSLNDTVLNAEPFLREVLSAQIVKTLAKIPEIKSVRINVGSQSLIVPNTPIRQSMTLWDKFSPDSNREADALAIQDGKIVEIDSEIISAISDNYFNSSRWFAATRNRGENILAAVSEDRTKLVVQNSSDGNPIKVIIEGQGLRVPRSDIFDSIWVTGLNQINVIQNNEVLNVSLDGIEKQNVIDVIPSTDGVRALLIVNTVYGSELRIGTISREDKNIKIGYIRKLIKDGFSVSQATWQDSSTVLFIDNFSDPASVLSVDVFNGLSKSLYTQIGSVNIASALKKETFLTLDNGLLLERKSGEWINRGSLINASYPG